MKKIITTHWTRSKEANWISGKQAGLKGNALDYFCYFGEIRVDLEVDMDTGEAVVFAVNGIVLPPPPTPATKD